MPVIVLAPKNALIEKIASNVQEVIARDGRLFIFSDDAKRWQNGFNENQVSITQMPTVPDLLAPIIYTIPMQLLSYHVAIFKGTDVDQPRNLAKSVTVE